MWFVFAMIFIVIVWILAKGSQKPAGDGYLPEAFVVFDLETTGLDAARHEIIEIAAIKYRKGRTTHETVAALVRPTKPIPPKITSLTGITQSMVDAEGESLSSAILGFLDFAEDLRLVSFNSDFDMGFLVRAAQSANRKVTNPVSCALKMARRAWPGHKSYALQDLARIAGVDVGTAHRALADSQTALVIYAAAAQKLKSHF